MGKDALFMLLTLAMHGGNWDYMARMFGIKGPTFEHLITRFLKTLSERVYERCVLNLADKFTMDACIERKRVFRHFPMARYATDVTFQQANRPSGNVQEGKKYYSGKHKLYGYKTEVSALPFGLAVNCSFHYPRSISDINILYRNIVLLEYVLEKSDKRKQIPDMGPHSDEYPNNWAMLVDNGYQGASDWLRTIYPKKKPKNGLLSLQDEAGNKKVSTDRVIVENFFDRQCSLWTVCSSKY